MSQEPTDLLRLLNEKSDRLIGLFVVEVERDNGRIVPTVHVALPEKESTPEQQERLRDSLTAIADTLREIYE